MFCPFHASSVQLGSTGRAQLILYSKIIVGYVWYVSTMFLLKKHYDSMLVACYNFFWKWKFNALNQKILIFQNILVRKVDILALMKQICEISSFSIWKPTSLSHCHHLRASVLHWTLACCKYSHICWNGNIFTVNVPL